MKEYCVHFTFGKCGFMGVLYVYAENMKEAEQKGETEAKRYYGEDALVVQVDETINTTTGRWIKLSDMLPELEKDVLLFESDATNHKTHVGFLTKYGSYEDEIDVYVEDGSLVDLDCFTHWMPLPEPPKGE